MMAYHFEAVQQDQDHFILQNDNKLHYVQWIDQKTHISAGFYDAQQGRYRRGFGGVLVFPGRLTPDIVSHFLRYHDGARSEGYDAGYADAQQNIRKALGL